MVVMVTNTPMMTMTTMTSSSVKPLTRRMGQPRR
jgi:hypothetical protein